jgi:amino acid adenylation domain-containing protein
MNEHVNQRSNIPPEQQAIRNKCFHPSGTFVEFPIEDVESSIPARFEKVARTFADRLALKMGEKSLTYDELNRYANRIARAILDRRGFESEPITLLFEQSVDLVAAIFGVLKAGKFYVVLDPSFPEERLQCLLEDSGSTLVLTNRHVLDVASKLTGTEHALLTIEIGDERYSPEDLDLPISPQDLVCIQYTSGSTGKPKGVVLPHRTVLQTVQRTSAESHFCMDDRFTLLHSLSFGSGHGNLQFALLNGGSVFGFDVKRENIERLSGWLKDEHITVYHSPPSLFRQLAESLPRGGMHPDLRLIRLSGAPISKRDFELYKTHFGSNSVLRIAMGSSEGNGICAAILDQNFSYPTEGVPIGYPRPGKTIFFLDDDGKQVAPGQIGEIAVKGQNPGYGYWKQGNATNPKFPPDPDGRDTKIYLTGDLGRMLKDGFVIHLGRKDLMAKIRGYRVDVSEVERALVEHPGVKEAAVAVWEREPNEMYLAGYIELRKDKLLNVSEIREFLENKLPDYMIPFVFTFVKSLPMTNGKLDRKALPKPDKQRPELRDVYVEPRNKIEKELTGIWAEVLQLDKVGVHDNFFELGGHSLTATRLLSRLRVNYRVDVALKSLFESPTVAAFAQCVENALQQVSRETILSLLPVPRGNSLPASFGQRALWFHEQLDPESRAYNLVSAYRLSGGLDVKALEQSINQIIDRHEVLRTVFEAVDGQPMQKILPAMAIELPVVDLTYARSDSTQESELRRIASDVAGQSYDLAQGPLLRTTLLQLADDEHVLLLAIHHVVFDGWSIGIFVRELSQIYNSLKSAKYCQLSKLHIQYADFAVWQRSRLDGRNLETTLSYWKSQLDKLPTLILPIKRFQPLIDTASSAREEFELSKRLTEELLSLSHRTGTTLFMVLLAAYNVALSRFTGQTDIAVGTPIAGRSHPAVEGLIGFFLNMLVLRTDASGNPTFCQLLERIRQVCIDAFAHQDVPFGRLVEELRPTRDLTNNPLVQVTFTLQNTPRQSLDLTGITARELDISAGVARSFDLHLFMVEEVSGLRGYVSYNSNLFATDTISRVIGHLKIILEAVVANPEQRISQIDLPAEIEATRASDAGLAQVLCEVEAMTDEEALKMLAGENMERTSVDGHE